MQKRKLGYTDLYLTTIGFGAWAVGGPWQFGWGPQDDADSIAAIRRALDLGVNWIDTAAAYGLGHSEEVVGRALKGRGERPIIATKCGLAWDEQSRREGKVFNRLKAASVRQEAEGSLRRLGVDVIDLYQIHWPNPDADIEEGWGEIAKLIAEGKIRYAGVSNFNARQIERARAIHPVASLQPPYSMLDRRAESELLPYCTAHNIGVVAYSPMASGFLTGKYTPARIAALPPDDMRHHSDHFQEPALGANLALIEKLRPIAERHGRNLAQLAVAWVLRRPEVTSAIVGGRNPAQVEDVIPAADWQLTSADLAEIAAALDQRARSLA